ncbi:hypothetical protein JG537_05120 [Streptococcus sp. SL1232]|uniref:hypothetical protein n=1 Tax=Streptococcus vicugnae TaxID=2740579 RepID=UPI0018F3FCE7|nr:hypothetical protein [Streptococcus vicugnae]MBJ7541099.1 hypothetical protein [Streptococcus vicugnae]
MVRNTFEDLNNHLFEQIERLNDDELSADELEREVKRAKSISAISDKIIKAAETQLKAYEMSQEYEGTPKHMPKLLGE